MKPTTLTDGDQNTSSYRVVLTLRTGGSATVSLAIARGIGGFRKLVVLKTLHEARAPESDAVRMFLDEARVSAHLNHPNVVQVYQVLERNQRPAIVMEYLDGQSFASILKSATRTSQNVPLEVRLTILAKTLSGLHYAHTLHDLSGKPLNLIHRDVSPTNVMVTYDGRVKLVDFGIAKFSAAEHRTQPETIVGKLRYMAPERLRGLCDSRVDVFAVGVMLWESLALRRFWTGASETEIVARLLAGDLPRSSDLGPDIDPELARICAKALAANPEDRYATAAEMQAELERYLAGHAGIVPESVMARVVCELCDELRTREHRVIVKRLSEMGLALNEPGDGSPFGAVGESPRPGDDPRRARGNARSARNWLARLGAGLVVSGALALSLQWLIGAERSEASMASALPAPKVVPPRVAATSPQPSAAENAAVSLAPQTPSDESAARSAPLPLEPGDPPVISVASLPEGFARASRPPFTRAEHAAASATSRVKQSALQRSAAKPPRRKHDPKPSEPEGRALSLGMPNEVHPDPPAILADVQPGSDLRQFRARRPIDEDILK